MPVWALGLSCETPAASGPQGRRETQRAKWEREREKTRNFGPPPFGAPSGRGPTLQGTTLGGPTSRGRIFSGFVPHPLGP